MDEKEMQDVELDSTQENYVPPSQKSVSEIIAADANDESLNRYKQALLGQAKLGQVIVDSIDPRNVLVRSITLVVDGRRDITMHLDKERDLYWFKIYTEGHASFHNSTIVYSRMESFFSIFNDEWTFSGEDTFKEMKLGSSVGTKYAAPWNLQGEIPGMR